LPNGQGGLTRCSKEERVNALKTFSDSLIGIADFAAIKSPIDSFYTLVLAARNTQPGSKSAQGQDSQAVNTAMEGYMIMQYKNLDLLMVKYASDSDIIETYFDLQTIQQSTQTSFSGTIESGENEAMIINYLWPAIN